MKKDSPECCAFKKIGLLILVLLSAGEVAIWKILQTEDRMTKEEMADQGLDVFMELFLLLTPKGL